MNTIKKFFVATGIFISIIIVGLFFLYMWLKNPYGLEPERITPIPSREIGDYGSLVGASNVFLHPEYKNSKYIIHLVVPNAYIGGGDKDKRIQSYGFLSVVEYPTMKFLDEKNNEEHKGHHGWYKGKMHLHVEASGVDAYIGNERAMKNRIEKDMSNTNPLVKFEKLGEEFGIKEHFQFRFPVIEQKSNGSQHSTNEYFVVRDESGKVKYLFDCRPYVPSPSCSLRINGSKVKELHVHISFGRHLMDNWKDLIIKTDELIASFNPSLKTISQ